MVPIDRRWVAIGLLAFSVAFLSSPACEGRAFQGL